MTAYGTLGYGQGVYGGAGESGDPPDAERDLTGHGVLTVEEDPPPDAERSLTGHGTLTVEVDVEEPEDPPVPPTIGLTILDAEVDRAPTSITAVASGGVANAPAILDIDGTDVLTVTLDTNGSMGWTSIPVSEALGAAGTHILRITQHDPLTDTTVIGQATFTVAFAPIAYPVAPPEPTEPVLIPAAVQKWVLQDPTPGGLGSYVLPINPKTMTAPHWEKALTSRRSTAAIGGRFHVFEAAGFAKPWQFAGYTWSEQMAAKLKAYGALNHRFWVIDHRNRAWQVLFTQVSIEPRLRQQVDGVLTDWGADFTVQATIFDQNWSTPQ